MASLLAISLTAQLLRRGADRSAGALAVVGALSLLLLVRRRHPLAATWTATALVLAVRDPTHRLTPDLLSVVVPVVLSYSCGAHAPMRPGLVAVAALTAALQVHVGFSDAPNLEIAIGTLPPWWGGVEVRRRREVVRALAARTRELEDEEEAFIRLSVQRERARIARDLHDIVSHHLAVIAVQAGAGRLARPWSGEAAAARLAAIGHAGREALREADRLVTLLDAGEGAPRLAPLLERARAGGAQVVLRPPDARLTAEIEALTCRVLQEALTNAIKHAPGRPAELDVDVGAEAVSITVRTELAAAPSALAATGSGLGLSGMEERLRARGGTLDARPDGHGRFELRAQIPLSPAPAPVA